MTDPRTSFIAAEVKRLQDLQYRIEGGKAAAVRLVTAWLDEFDGISAQEFHDAITAHIAVSDYIPKPRNIWAHIYAGRGQGTQATAQEVWNVHPFNTETGEALPCPTCGAKYEFDPDANRIKVAHDEQAHESAGVGVCGYAQ